MPKENQPTDQQWKELYQAASHFAKLEPWKTLRDIDLIGVENPKDKSIGYCSVTGGGGMHYALGVYLDTEGLHGFLNYLAKAENTPINQMLHYNDCLMCSFEEMDVLSGKDKKKIKDLGLDFQGEHAWPMFRRYQPGFYPWYISDEECVFLTQALQQTIQVLTALPDGPIKIDMDNGKTILRYGEEKDGGLEWQSREFQVVFPKIEYNPVVIEDEVLIQRLKDAGKSDDLVLQAENCYMPSPVKDEKGGRPYYPRICVFVDQQTGQIMEYEMYKSIDEDANVTLNKMIGMCLKSGLPKQIQVSSEKMEAILGDFCKKTGTKLKVVRRLNKVEQMMEELERLH